MSDSDRSPARRTRRQRSLSRSPSRSVSPAPRRRMRSNSRERRRSRSRSGTPSDGARLHVTDIGYHISSSDLEREFTKFGRLVEVWMSKSQTNPYAFVVFRTAKDAEKAAREMDGISINGSRIRVSHARPRNMFARGGEGGPRGRPMSDQRCYSCSKTGHFARDCPDSMGRDRSPRRSSYRNGR
uniref:Serine/arginine-rich splicing factor RSZ21 n=1 Tax=Cacopsylla melanoneura TaxID=428564 RepID=A0A8D9B6N4_9HEMI